MVYCSISGQFVKRRRTRVPEKGGAYAVFPYDIRKEFGKGRVKVRAFFDGVPYDGSIVNMGVKNRDGSVCYVLGMPKSIREQLGKGQGDEVEVVVIPQGADEKGKTHQ